MEGSETTCFPRQTVGGSEKSRLCSVLALKSAGFSLASVQNNVLSFCLHSHNLILYCPIASMFCDMLAHLCCWCHGHVSRTMYTPSCIERRILQLTVSGSTGLFDGHRSGFWRDKSGASYSRSWTVSRVYSDTRTHHFRRSRSYLKANKVQKVEYACHF